MKRTVIDCLVGLFALIAVVIGGYPADGEEVTVEYVSLVRDVWGGTECVSTSRVYTSTRYIVTKSVNAGRKVRR